MFLTTLSINHKAEIKAGNKSFVTARPFSFLNHHDQVVTVPVGFEFDGASVPLPVWGMFPPAGEYLEAVLIHDWLYETQQIQSQWIDRSSADQHLLWGMESLGVSWFKRQVIYRAVRLSGWISFKRYGQSIGNPRV